MDDFLVIGKGLFGAAAARYLSGGAGRVTILGPDEPDEGAAAPVHGSHYDAGRLTGLLGRSETWSRLARSSIAQYRPLEAASGVRFYEPRGRLHVPAGRRAPRPEAQTTYHTPESLRQAFPYLRFPPGFDALFEHAPAGLINPRALVQAQLAVAQRNGARVVRETAVRLDLSRDGVTVTTERGTTLRARKVLLATGAFANCFGLSPRPLPLRVKSETIILAEVDASEAARLAEAPVLDYELESDVLEGIYMTPPLAYPDGRFYLKMGCNTTADQFFDDCDAMRAWFVAGDSGQVKEAMAAALRSILPDLAVQRLATKRCIVTYTPSDHPIIDAIAPGRVYAAVGGNGTGAHASDGVGRAAAGLVAEGVWPSDLPRALFKLA